MPDQPIHVREQQDRPQEEAGPSTRRKRPRIDQLWHGNLQDDARALVILLQVGSVEPGGHEVTFQGCFEGTNREQTLWCMVPTREGRGHQRFLEGPVHPLARADRTGYVAATVRRILDFLQM